MCPMVVVKKFGGTSLGSLERIELVAERILEDVREKGEKPLIVASAMSGETNRLVQLAQKISPTDRSAAYDMLLASGEQVSISLLAMALNKRGQKAQPMLAHQMGMKTNNLHSKASIESIDTKVLNGWLDQGVIPIVAGFQGVDDDGQITTLGRGGSDTSAVAIAAAMGHKICEIYTDVPAIFTSDPRLVKTAVPLEKVSFYEMMEMASLGTKVLHARSVELASKFGVQIHLRSTFEKREGTLVVPQGEIMEKPVVTAVTHDPKTSVIKLFPVPSESQFLATLFSTLAEKGIIVDIITQSQGEEGQRLAFSVNRDDLSIAVETIKTLVAPETKVMPLENMAKISVVGVGMQNEYGVAARFFSALAGKNIPIHLVTTSDIKISAVIDFDQLQEAAQGVHDEFRLEEGPS